MVSRNYCFTINNPSGPLDFETCVGLRYMIYQEEVGANGTTHYQGYLELSKASRMAAIKKWPGFESAHLEVRRGTQDQAIAYCKKKDDTYRAGPWEFGEIVKQGHRSDLKRVHEMVKDGKTDREICDEMPGDYIRYSRGIKAMRSLYVFDRCQAPDMGSGLTDWQNEVIAFLEEPVKRRRIIWIWSDASNQGKSTFRDYVQYLYKEKFLLGGDRMMDTLYAYDQHSVIWFDIPRQMPLDASLTSQLEALSDGGIRLSTKYEATSKFISAHVVVTCNRPPPHEKLPQRLVEIRAQLNVPLPFE